MTQKWMKAIAICLALAMLMVVPVSANDYSHSISSFAKIDGTDDNAVQWWLELSTSIADAYGNTINGYTGFVSATAVAQNYCNAVGDNCASITDWGEGTYAEISFYNVNNG